MFLKSLFALPMERDERRLFKKCTGLKKAPTRQARESYVIAGRRSGKSFISAVVSVFLALFHDWKPFLATGEKGWILKGTTNYDGKETLVYLPLRKEGNGLYSAGRATALSENAATFVSYGSIGHKAVSFQNIENS